MEAAKRLHHRPRHTKGQQQKRLVFDLKEDCLFPMSFHPTGASLPSSKRYSPKDRESEQGKHLKKQKNIEGVSHGMELEDPRGSMPRVQRAKAHHGRMDLCADGGLVM